jgi:hypothetical protein
LPVEVGFVPIQANAEAIIDFYLVMPIQADAEAIVDFYLVMPIQADAEAIIDFYLPAKVGRVVAGRGVDLIDNSDFNRVLKYIMTSDVIEQPTYLAHAIVR